LKLENKQPVHASFPNLKTSTPLVTLAARLATPRVSSCHMQTSFQVLRLELVKPTWGLVRRLFPTFLSLTPSSRVFSAFLSLEGLRLDSTRVTHLSLWKIVQLLNLSYSHLFPVSTTRFSVLYRLVSMGLQAAKNGYSIVDLPLRLKILRLPVK